MYPRMYGDKGWYGWTPQPYAENGAGAVLLSMKPDDAARAGRDPWLDYLRGRTRRLSRSVALRQDLARVRHSRWPAMRRRHDHARHAAGRRPDEVQPRERRLAARTWRWAALHPGRGGNTLTAAPPLLRRRARRPGLPPDVAALVDADDRRRGRP